MSTLKLPDDYWHSYVYVCFGWFACVNCEVSPDLEWAWDSAMPGEEGATIFTTRAVPHLKEAGWIMHGDEPYCPDCVSSLGLTPDEEPRM